MTDPELKERLDAIEAKLDDKLNFDIYFWFSILTYVLLLFIILFTVR